MQYKIGIPILSLIFIVLAACNSESEETQASEEHVWKDQTGAIDKAREVETILQRKQDPENQ